MNKVIVIGSPGSGKSTFARKLRDKTGLPLYHLDMIWHKPDKTTIPRDEFNEHVAEILATDRWIIDGNYSRTLTERLEVCDTVFLFDLPANVCVDGAASRVNQKREDLPWIEDKLDEEFRQYILDFPDIKLPLIYELLEQYANTRQVYVFHSRKEAENFLNAFGE